MRPDKSVFRQMRPTKALLDKCAPTEALADEAFQQKCFFYSIFFFFIDYKQTFVGFLLFILPRGGSEMDCIIS